MRLTRSKIRLELRKWYWLRRARRTGAILGQKPAINYRTVLSAHTSVGNNFNCNGLEIHGWGSVSIGDNFHCGKNCIIMTNTHNYKGDAIPYDDTDIVEDTVIGDNVWFGMGVILLPGVSIGEGAIIQAGSVVTNDIAPLAIAGGHPARQFAERDAAHYKRLKSLGKFF